MKTLITILALCCFVAISFIGCRHPSVVEASIALNQQNDVNRAQEQLEIALADNPNDFEAHYMMGQVYARKKMYPEMLAEFDKSLAVKTKYKTKIDSIKNKHFFNLYNGAVNYFNNNKLDRAIKDLKMAVLITPDDQQGWALLGKSHVRNEKTAEAIVALEKATEFDPNFEAITDRILLLQLYYEEDRFEEALSAATEVLRYDDANIDAVKIAAFCYNALDQKEKALEYYENLLKDQPDDADLVFNLGLLYEQMERYDEAIQLFERAFELNPTDLEAILHCAQVYLEVKEDNLKALECYEKALEIQPDNPGVLNNYGIALIRAGEQTDDQSLITRGAEVIKRASEIKSEGQ